MSTQSALEDQAVSSEDRIRVWRSILQIGQAGRADFELPTDEAPDACPQWNWAREERTWRVKL